MNELIAVFSIGFVCLLLLAFAKFTQTLAQLLWTEGCICSRCGKPLGKESTCEHCKHAFAATADAAIFCVRCKAGSATNDAYGIQGKLCDACCIEHIKYP